MYANLPYRVNFFSSNLEHVLHNKQSVSADEKSKYAEKFVDKFITNLANFIEFMNSTEFALTGQYKDTWDFIKKDIQIINKLFIKSVPMNSQTLI